MKVLISTDQTQGWRANDFCWTVEGELVFFPPPSSVAFVPRNDSLLGLVGSSFLEGEPPGHSH
jgi:hypothetical protein